MPFSTTADHLKSLKNTYFAFTGKNTLAETFMLGLIMDKCHSEFLGSTEQIIPLQNPAT